MYDLSNLPDFQFPKGFLCGSACSAYQTEGDNVHSHRWAPEQEGKLGTPSGKACNGWQLYKQDIELIHDLGHQAYRWGPEWSRLEPTEGEFDHAAAEQYVDMARRLAQRGIKNFVTLWHWSYPDWYEKRGAFFKQENFAAFERYVSYIVPKLAPYVDYWHIFNEFNLHGLDMSTWKLNVLHMHARCYHLIKSLSSGLISCAHAFPYWGASRPSDRFDNIATDFTDWMTHEFFFHAIRTGEIVLPFQDAQYDPLLKGACDFWSVNYYTRHMVDSRLANPKAGKTFAHKHIRFLKAEEMYLKEIYPEGLIANLERLKDLPVYITENGLCCDDDRWRIIYIALHLMAIKEAIDRGVDVRGYLYWCLMDNYEWGSFEQRFGIVECDFKTFNRTPRPSAFFLRDVIRNNGFSQEILRKYLPAAK